jgi:hypothetical protein
MIERKQEVFAFGIQIFIDQVCGRDQLNYTNGMVHQDGYRFACKEFYKNSGYLTKEDRDELFNNGVVPDWMKDIFMQVERKNFGISIWDKQ